MKLSLKYFIVLFSILCFFSRVSAQTTNVSGIINNYTSISSIGSQSVNVVTTSGFAVGDKVLLIQMKGASIDTTNTSNFGTITSYNEAGNYEMLVISAITSTTITFTNPILRTYNTTGVLQLVKVPVYNNVNIIGLLTCTAWNGSVGGVLVFEATGNVTLNANIDVTGKGFLGGTISSGQFFSCSGNTSDFKLFNTSFLSANKGEGIAITKSSFAKGLGALANGGGAGNDVNGGGAGGGNYGLGGHGGNSKCSSSPIALCGGYEGKNCIYSNVNNKIFLGGGGGAGHENDGVSTAGVAGGGIVIIRSGGSIIGNGNFINANGNNNTLIAGNDGQGGGGAGGTVLIEACSTSSLNISVIGGNGGTDNFSGPDCHGKGGGGGGGVIWTSSSLSYISFLNGGNPGVFTNAASQCFNTSNGATSGQVGGILSGLLIPGATPLVSVGSFSLTTSSNCISNNNSTATASVSSNATSPVFSYTWTNSGGVIVSQTNNTSSLSNSVPNLSNGVYTLSVQMNAPCGPINTQTLNINCVVSPTQSCSGSLVFNNVSDEVLLPLNNQMYSSNGFTWECWFKLNTPFGSMPRSLIMNEDPVVYEDIFLGFGWNLGTGNFPINHLGFKVDGPNATTGPTNVSCDYLLPGGFIIGAWYHAAGVMDYVSQTAKLYLNGLLVDTKTVISDPLTRTIQGHLSYSPNLGLGGNLDEVRIWKRVRTGAEILSDYNHCLVGNEIDLVSYYRCNQSSGSTVIDGTVNGNNGTFANSTAWSTQQPNLIGGACLGAGIFSVSAISSCSGSNSTAIGTVTTSVTSPTISYTWLNLGGNVVSQTNNSTSLIDSVINLPNGVYTFSVLLTTPCGTVANTQTLTINCTATPTISIALFSSPDTVCVNQSFSVSNLSTGANSNYWTFCQSNTNSTPQAINLGNVGFFNGPVFITIAKEGTDYYAFVVNNTFGDLTKLFFGSSLLNTPIATNLGNISGAFPGSLEDIHIEYEGGNWYGIVVGGFGGSESIIRIDFGSSLANNAPTAVNYGNIGGLDYPQRLKIFKNGANYYGFTTNRNNNTFTRFSFGTSISNTPTGLNLGNIGALNTPDAIAIVNVASMWYGYIINEGDNTITRLDFGNSLLNTPTGTNLGNTGALNGPRGIDMWTECNEVRGLITNRFSDDLLNMNLSAGPTGPVVTTSFGNIANFSFPHSITRFRSGDTLFAFITNVSNNTLSRIYYPGCVNSSIASSTLTAPPAISYNAPGNYYINLVINEGQITQTNYCKQVTVIASPTIIVSNANICAGSSASLTASGANSYSWTSSPSLSSTTDSLVTTTPSVSESYTVTGFIGSCTNTAVSSVTIIPSPSITIIPTLSTICSGQTTTLTAIGASTYTWNSSGTLNTSSGNMVIASPLSTTNYSVTGTLNTCTNSAFVTVSVLANPTLILNPNATICQGAGASTTLTATGATSYTWANAASLSSSTGSVVIASPNVTTNYTVTGSNATCTNTAIVTVNVNPSPTITATTINNTSCGLSNGSATVISLPSNNTYTWSSGVSSTTNTASNLATGNYTITANNGTCNTNTIVTILSSAPLLITSNTITPSNCNLGNGSISVIDNMANTNYSWSPSVSTSSVANNLAAGNYSLTLTNGACTSSTIFVVGILGGPTGLSTSVNNVICESVNGSVVVNNVINGVAPYQYSFNNSGYSSVLSYSNLAQGTYTLSVKDVNGCLYSQTLTIGQSTINSIVALTTNTPNCESNDGSFVIDSIKGGTLPYMTSFNNTSYSSNTTFENLSTGSYTLNVRDSNMCETGFILIMPENNYDYTLYIPNTFTPNNDKVNDVWYIQGTCLGELSCLIYNRWGEKIRELRDIKEGWDGTYKGASVPDGVYVYLIELETQNGTINKAGHITLFR
jgi:gliding motility-associated-like protein